MAERHSGEQPYTNAFELALGLGVPIIELADFALTEAVELALHLLLAGLKRFILRLSISGVKDAISSFTELAELVEDLVRLRLVFLLPLQVLRNTKEQAK